MRGKIVKIIACIGLVIIGLVLFATRQNQEEYEVSESDLSSALALLNERLDTEEKTYFNYLENTTQQENPKTYEAIKEFKTKKIDRNEAATYEVTVEDAGYYELYLTYKVSEESLVNPTVSVTVNDQILFEEATTIDLPLYWQDETKEFTVDSYGDQSLPPQKRVLDFVEYGLNTKEFLTSKPTLFKLEAGKNQIDIENVTSEIIEVKDLNVKQPVKTITYQEYLAQFDEVKTQGAQPLFINATEYSQKNSSFVRLLSTNNPSLTPHDPVYKKLNVIDGDSWKTPGQSITYNFTVETEGFYELSLHYLNDKDDFSVFREIKLDDEVVFEELEHYEFEVTPSGLWANETLGNDEENFKFYLTEGEHSITLTVDYELLSEQISQMELVSNHITQFALDIIKVTGNDIDKNRTWKLTKFLPETQQYLEAYKVIIMSIIEHGGQYSPIGQQSATLSFLEKAVTQLEKMLENPDELPLYLDSLYSGSGSVSQMLGDTMTALTNQPLSLNGIYVHQDEKDLKAPNSSIFKRLEADAKSFIATFTSEKYSTKVDDDVLNIWVNRPITHIDTMQKLADSMFTQETGIKVKISAMPDANKLILSNAAGETPDIAMGLASYMPFDLAIRDAAYNLTTFDDFWEVASSFAPGSLIPYILNDSIYGLPETLEFQATFYRTDILNSLGVQTPDTWEDVTNLLPTLQRYGMNFYHPTAGGTSLKWFYQTSPLIYQNGGSLYTEDGLQTTINSKESVEGLSQLNQLFTKYAMKEQVISFYNSFRYGTLPVGIGNFSEYLQIKNAAPELVGKWDISLYPGTEQEDGSINRWFISNGVGSLIFKDTDKPDQSWEFLKWWMSEETQTNYSYTLQTTFGPEYVWLSANLDAVANSPLDDTDKQIILESAKWLRDVPRTPGQYMLERGLSDIWNRSVFNGISTRVAIDRQVVTINREMEKKMIEFGFIDIEGNKLKDFIVRDIDWVYEQLEAHGSTEGAIINE